MMMRRRYCSLALGLSLTAGIFCKKEVGVRLNSVAPQVVIEAAISNEPGPYTVRISKTVDFSATNDFPGVTGASIIITDSTLGKQHELGEVRPGFYISDSFRGEPGHVYKLAVMAEGKTYEARCAMPYGVRLDSVTFAVNTDFSGNKDRNALVNFQDPAGVTNFYQFTESINGRKIPNTFVFEDRLSDGRYIEQPLFNDSTYLQKGDSLLLRMYCIDKAVYNYFFSLIQVTNNGGIQGATPDNPVTNIKGGALGYFSAHTVEEMKAIVY